MNRLLYLQVRVAALGVLTAFQPALAADSTVLEEITITAEKRASTVQATPVSIVAFTGEDLANAGVSSTEALAGLTPGLTVQKEVIGKVVIRGVGTENYTVGSDPGVAIHKDGVYIARSSVAMFDFFDVSRIEVLRGPQGTLYGRNASGGVINIISNEPGAEFGGYVKADVGNYAKRRLEAVLNAPLSDGARLRISGLYAERDGYTINKFPGLPAVPANPVTGFPGYAAIPSARSRGVDQLDNQELGSVRAQLDIDIGDSVSLLMQGELIRDDSLPPAFKYFEGAPWAGAGDLVLPDLREVSQGLETAIPGSGRTVPSVGRADQDGFSARLTWDLGGSTFTSLTAYRKIDFSWINDGDGFDQFFVTYFQTDESKQLTQEFQLSGGDDTDFKWILGAYYLDEEAKTFTGIPFILPIFPAPYILWDGTANTQAFAVFGQGTYSINDRLRVTAGLRYNKEDKNGSLAYNLFGGLLPEPELDDSWNAVTPKLGFDYDFSENVMGYVSATRGFKSGGFNLIALQGPYDPEYLWAYELGLKTKGAGGRLIANFGAFYYDYKDLQVGKVVNLSATVVNAAKATIKGLEAELRAAPGGGFEISAGLAWLDAKYDEFETDDPGFTGNPSAPGALGCGRQVGAPATPPAVNRTISLKGCKLPRAPEIQGALGVQWTGQVAGGELWARADYAYRGDQYFTQFNRDNVAQNAYGTVNARVGFRGRDNRWALTLWGDNLTDKEYFSTVLESGVAAPGTVVPQAVLGAPRTYGLSAQYNF